MNSPTWDSHDPPEDKKISALGWVRVILRGAPLAVLVFGGLLVFSLIGLIERALHGGKRPWTPFITVFVCRNALRLLGIRWTLRGTPMRQKGGLVANHTSWLDIFSLNAVMPLYFVAKSEVSGWLGIGWLARATDTLFVRRDPREARSQMQAMRARLSQGHKLLFFPEGTSTDGLQVLPFKTSLFASFLQDDMRSDHYIQAISVVYHAPPGQDPRFYGWWGTMGFGAHLLSTLAAAQQGGVEILCHPPVPVSDFSDRKKLAKALENLVRQGHQEALKAQ